jgi:HEAT repeat protein
MPMQCKRSWVLLTSFAGCAWLATTGFTLEPPAWMRLARARAGDAQQISNPQPLDSAQTNYLIRLLESSPQFRVRAQAAISLGLIENSLAAREALTAALQDVHPAVRAAAATSLGRLGDASRVVALRKLGGDTEEPVRNAARASIAKLESMIVEPPPHPEETATTAALSATTSTSRL